MIGIINKDGQLYLHNVNGSLMAPKWQPLELGHRGSFGWDVTVKLHEGDIFRELECGTELYYFMLDGEIHVVAEQSLGEFCHWLNLELPFTIKYNGEFADSEWVCVY